MDNALAVPLLLHYPMNIEDLLAFILGMLFAVTLNAEAQAFMATSMGDRRTESGRRFTFNPILHLDPLGTLAFCLGGFGWARWVDIDPSKFSHPRLYTIIIRLSGPLANLFLASIGGSIVMLAQAIQFHPGLFPGVIAVNVAAALYNLLPIPPLALGCLWTAADPVKLERLQRRLGYICGGLLVLVLGLDRLYHLELFSRYFNPLITTVFAFIVGQN